MNTTDLFARLVRDLCTFMLDAADAPLEQRIHTLWRSLGMLAATGASLPVVPGCSPSFKESPLSDWPGLGTYEAYWRETDEGPVPMQLSQTLAFIFQQLWAGLESFDSGEEERAAASWGAGFATTWGPAALEVLEVLHTPIVRYREDALEALRPRTRSSSPLVMVGGGSPPKKEPLPDRPTLGLRIRPTQGGIEILAIHPKGPSAGVFQPGDILLDVDGHPLDGQTEAEAGAAITGPIGQLRTYGFYRDGESYVVDLASRSVRELS